MNIEQVHTWLCQNEYSFGNSTKEIKDFTLDSRDITPNSLFFAIKGKRTDGHAFLLDVIKAGAAAIVFSTEVISSEEFITLKDEALVYDVAWWSVDDVEAALVHLATSYRLSLEELKVVAVTGSYGKTTTKQLLYSVLSKKYETFMAPGNLNSHLGLPLAILKTPETTQVAVWELGIDFVGEMDILGKMSRPDVAIVVTLGLAHSQFLGGFIGVVEQKLRLRHYVKEGGAFFFPSAEFTVDQGVSASQFLVDPDLLSYYQKGVSEKEVSDVKENGLNGFSFTYHENEYISPLLGKQHLINCLCAIECAEFLGITPREISLGLSIPHYIQGRANYIEGEPCLLDDSYNASLSSVLAGLDFISRLNNAKNTHVVLGDMLELGEFSEMAHDKVVKRLLMANFAYVYLYGNELEKSWEKLNVEKLNEKIKFFSTLKELEQELQEKINKSDLVYIKGSQSTRIFTIARTVETWQTRANN